MIRGLVRLALSIGVAGGGLLVTEAPAVAAPLVAREPTQVVVFDRLTHTTAVVSHDVVGTPGTASSSRPSVSGDGAFVAFESSAALVTEDANNQPDVYLWTRASDTVQRISVGPAGVEATGSSQTPSISADGGVIAFVSTAPNLTPDAGLTGTVGQVFAWQAATGLVSLVSIGPGGPANAPSRDPAVSADGRVVAFSSEATRLVRGDTNGVSDVFLRDLGRGATIRASVDAAGKQISVASGRPSITANGGAVIFDTTSRTVVPRDTNGARDVFLRDLPPAALVGPNPVDFGVVPLGTPASQVVTVTSVGWTPLSVTATTIEGTAAGDFVVAGDACTGLTLEYGATCTVAVLDVPTATGPRLATLLISDTARDSPQRVELRGGVAAPQVRIDPLVGPPGIVATVAGTGFPPGALVDVRWDRGISQAVAPTVVAPDGTFAVALLVFHNDALGPRQAIVSAAPGGPTFGDEVAPFLVVPATIQPPGGSSAIRYLAPEVRILIVRH